jgi:hypothetical protein
MLLKKAMLFKSDGVLLQKNISYNVYENYSFKESVIVTIAICFKCGHFKKGALNPCENCAASPSSEEELASSIVLTDHYFNQVNLEHLATWIKDGGRAELSPGMLREWIGQIRDSGMRTNG